jgi:transcriptional regulator with XRE-family HTH domain
MESLGERLRAERERRGLSIAQLAERTRIKKCYFEAIENDDPAGVPGGFFYRSFIRQYARLLGLPDSAFSEEIARSLEDEKRAMDIKERTPHERRIGVPPMPTGRGNGALEMKTLGVRFAALLGVVVGCGLLYSGYMRWGSTELSRSLAWMPAPGDHSAPPSASNAAPAATAASQQRAGMERRDAAAPVGQYEIQLTLRAIEDTWVQVTQHEQRVFSGILRQGEMKVLEGAERLRVRLGNAGGVEIEWNGRPVPPMGMKGQVREVEFTPEDYSVAPARRPPADHPSL